MDNSKKEDIINACIKEFAEYGFKGANTNRIYKEAGVSKGLIFHYYGSKEKLFTLAVERCIDKAMESFKQINTDNLNFMDSIIIYNNTKSKFFIQNPSCYKILTHALYNAPEELKAQLEAKHDEMYSISIQMLAKLFDKVKLKDGVSKESAMQAVIAIIEFMHKKYTPIILNQSNYPEDLIKKIEGEFNEQLSLILYGISCKY